MENRFELLKYNEVVSIESKNSDKVLSLSSTSKISEFMEAISERAYTNEEKNFFKEGLECEALRFGAKDWQKGKVRICLEFCPDESEASETPESSKLESSQSESLLDDLRHMTTRES